MGQQGNVFTSLAERRHVQGKSAQAEKKVLPEIFVGNGLLEFSVRCGDYGHVNREIDLATQTADFSGFQHPQEFTLEIAPYITDFIKKNGASVGQLKHAFFICFRIGESPFGMTKKLAFNKVVRQSGTVHRYIRPIFTFFSPALMQPVMHVAGQDFLACPGFSGDKNSRNPCKCNCFSVFYNILDNLGFPHHFMMGMVHPCFSQIPDLILQFCFFENSFDDHDDFVNVKGLGQVITGPDFHGPDC